MFPLANNNSSNDDMQKKRKVFEIFFLIDLSVGPLDIERMVHSHLQKFDTTFWYFKCVKYDMLDITHFCTWKHISLLFFNISSRNIKLQKLFRNPISQVWYWWVWKRDTYIFVLSKLNDQNWIPKMETLLFNNIGNCKHLEDIFWKKKRKWCR